LSFGRSLDVSIRRSNFDILQSRSFTPLSPSAEGRNTRAYDSPTPGDFSLLIARDGRFAVVTEFFSALSCRRSAARRLRIGRCYRALDHAAPSVKVAALSDALR
jgi:hypothetical protein